MNPNIANNIISLEDLENEYYYYLHSGGDTPRYEEIYSARGKDEEILKRIEIIRKTLISSYTEDKKTHVLLKNVLENSNSLQKHKVEVPKYSNDNEECLKFTRLFVEKFFIGQPLDLEGYNTYLFSLIDEIKCRFAENKDFTSLELSYQILDKFYPFARKYIYSDLAMFYSMQNRFELAWEFFEKSSKNIETVYFFEKQLGRILIHGRQICDFLKKSEILLTDFGTKNLNKIIPLVEQKYFESFDYKRNNFTSSFELKLPIIPRIVLDGLLLHFFSARHNTNWMTSPRPVHYMTALEWYINIVKRKLKTGNDLECKVKQKFITFVAGTENDFRVANGLPKVGEGWISETELFYYIKEQYPKHEVKHHGKLVWLGKQHLDIYFPQLNIGIEYQGTQHFQPVGIFGGEEGFQKTVQRDKLKKEKCISNGCILIIVEENYKTDTVKQLIDEAIEQRLPYN